MQALPPLSLSEWLVLAVLNQQSMHGFAVAQLTLPQGELGRVWQIPKAVVYRSIARLLDAGLVVPDGIEQALGPQRTVYAVTPAGSEAAQQWLHTPVEHVRDIRSHLLLKLALLDRAGGDPTDLLLGQRAVLEPIAKAIEDQRAQADGFDAVLLAWRRATAVAAMDFLDTVAEPPPPVAHQDGPRTHLADLGANYPPSRRTRPAARYERAARAKK